MGVPAFAATAFPTTRSYSRRVENLLPDGFCDETGSSNRTRRVVPAGSVTLLPMGAAAAPAAAGVADGAGVRAVKVNATASEGLMTCMPALVSKLIALAPPPANLPLRTVPFL